MQSIKVKVYCEIDNQFSKFVKEFPIETEKECVKDDSPSLQEFLEEFKVKTYPSVLELVTLANGENEVSVKRGFDRSSPDFSADDCDFSIIYHFCVRPGVGDERFLLKAHIQD